MALIGKIREKSWLLVGLIGLALFAFILSDYQRWIGQPDQMGYGSIDGEMVDFKLYEKASENYKMADEREFQQQGRPYTLRDQAMSENKAWNAIVDSIILTKEFKKLGVSVSDREFEAYLYGHDGFNVIPSIAESFKDPATGLYSEKLLRKRVDEMKSSSNPDEQRGWEQTKTSLTLQRLQEKYFQLLAQGVYTTDLEAKDLYVAQKRTKNISFVVKRFSEIPDTDIKVTDAELVKYYETKKNDVKYRTKSNSRDIKYIALNIVPSKEDSIELNKELDKLKATFAKISTVKDDSIFVVRNSEFPNYLPKTAYRSENEQNISQNFTYPAAMDSVFAKATVGTIVGPYMDKGAYRLAKVTATDNYIYSVRHILLNAQRTDTAAVVKAKAQADSLVKVLNASNFEEHVMKFSGDQASLQNGGKYENFIHEQMVPEFSNFARENNVGKIGWVQTDYGIHIIEVLDKHKGLGLAIIEKTLKPSSNTLDDINLLANDLVAEFVNVVDKKTTLKEKNDAFDTLAYKKGYIPMSITIDEKTLSVTNMKSPLAEDKMISIAFSDKSKVGEVSLTPIKDEDRYLIAMLAIKRDKGTPSFEAIEPTLRRDYINDKKAEILKSKMNSKNIEEVAKKNEIEVQNADVTFANPSIMGGGYDPEIVGMLFSKGIKDGTTTLPLQGRNGVYVIRVDRTIAEPATKSYEAEQQMLQGQSRGTLQNDVINALREKSNIVDNRKFLRIGIRR